MSELATLRTLTGMPDVPAPLGKSALVMVDLQNTYTRGVMRLDEVEPAIDAFVPIRAGLRDGDAVVTDGSFVLKAIAAVSGGAEK